MRRLTAVAVAAALVVLGGAASAAGDAGAGSGSPDRPAEIVQRHGAPAPLFGFMDDPEQHLFAIDAAVDIGSNVGRVTIPWYFTGWATLDELYDVFYANGIRPIFTLSVTPAPGPGPASPSVPPPTFPLPLPAPQPENLPPAPRVPDVQTFRPAEYASQAAYMVQRYPWAKIQLLNEPNLPQFRSFTVDQTVEVVTTAARAVHRVAPQVRLIGPASSPDQGQGYAYTREVYDHLPPDLDYVDAATNIYPGPGITRAFRQLKKSWQTARATGRKVWVTEITPGIYSPRRRRCNQIKQAFSYLKAKGAKGILFFRLREPQVVQNVQGRLWVVNLDGTHTDLYACLKKAATRLRKPGLPSRTQLRLTVLETSLMHRGTEVRVRFLATGRADYGSLGHGPREPVAGVRVAIGDETSHTNRLGRATITAPIGKARRHPAKARRPGYRADVVTIRLRAQGKRGGSGAKKHWPGPGSWRP